MNKEIKICQNCKHEFIIEPEDFDFYEKIKVPAPTFCPECRMQRRMAIRNERSLYKDSCDLCGKHMLSIYSPDKPFKVYCRECWYGDDWDPLSYGMDCDFSKPFFKQWRELIERVPRINLFLINNIGTEYANFIVNSKNIYLSYSIVKSEDVYYSRSVDKSKQSFDCFNGQELELCYENVDCARNYRSSHLLRSRDCIDSAFLFDCVNCQNCFMSSNLRNRQYVIRNKQYSKDSYQTEIARIDSGKAGIIAELKKEFSGLMLGSLHKFAQITKSVDAIGDNLQNVKNAKYTFDAYGVENVKYLVRGVTNAKDVYDVVGAGIELAYEGTATGLSGSNLKFFSFMEFNSDVEFSDWCQSSSHLFACSALRKKSYCIFNKQYSKEEYPNLVSRIVKHMDDMPYTDKQGRIYKYGEFYPIELLPWAYNETLAQEYFPLTKEQVLERGYSWREPDPYPHKPTMQPSDLPDDIKDVQDSITNEIIGCPDCGRAYRIIKPELDFLRAQRIALPRKCPDCRHRDRFALRNPINLWHRQCMCDYKIHANTVKHAHHQTGSCPNEFETSYAPERKETVYCEQCYNAEVV